MQNRQVMGLTALKQNLDGRRRARLSSAMKSGAPRRILPIHELGPSSVKRLGDVLRITPCASRVQPGNGCPISGRAVSHRMVQRGRMCVMREPLPDFADSFRIGWIRGRVSIITIVNTTKIPPRPSPSPSSTSSHTYPPLEQLPLLRCQDRHAFNMRSWLKT
jgi:hypothetical protein